MTDGCFSATGEVASSASSVGGGVGASSFHSPSGGSGSFSSVGSYSRRFRRSQDTSLENISATKRQSDDSVMVSINLWLSLFSRNCNFTSLFMI